MHSCLQREKGDCSAWSPHRWCLRRCIFAGWERQCLPLIKNKSSHKRSILRPNGFLPLQEARFPPIIKANIRGSEDGAENIPPAPALRPVSGISPKCWGKYFNRKISHHLYFSRIDYPVFGVSWLITFINLKMPLKQGQANIHTLDKWATQTLFVLEVVSTAVGWLHNNPSGLKLLLWEEIVLGH